MSTAALDMELEKIFDIAAAWKAIVLIDEADIFLEQRSLHDLGSMCTPLLAQIGKMVPTQLKSQLLVSRSFRT